MASSAGNGVEVNFPFADSNSLVHGGYGGSGSGGNGFKLLQDYNTPASSIQPPWMVPMPSTASMSKALADLAPNQQQMPKEQSLSSFLASSPMPSFGRFAPTSHVPPFPLSLEAQQGFRHTNRGYGGQTRQFPLQYVGNGGSLVLDRARGELINLSKMTPQEILDAKAIAASKSHSEAERRRRERINNHLATLRSLLPSTTKTDKASLLAEVIEHVKELKRQAAEIAEGGPVPTDVDELKVDSEAGEGNVVLRASLCCDDRPNLLSDLTKAIKSLKLKTLKAEFATLGGRVKNVILLTNDPSGICTSSTSSSSSDNSEADQSIPSASSVQEALRAVIERSAELTPVNGYGGNKRQKLVNDFPSTY